MDSLVKSARLSPAACVDEAGGKGENDIADDASTCAPGSVCLRLDPTDSAPPAGFDDSSSADLDSCAVLPESVAAEPTKQHHEVCIVHHDDMQLHVPPRVSGIYELPRRVVAIENALKGLHLCSGITKRTWGNEPMQFLRGKRKHDDRPMVLAFGSRCAKKRRLSCSTGSATSRSAWATCRIVKAPEVSDADLRLVHSRRHIDSVGALCAMAVATDAAFFPLDRPLTRPPRRRPRTISDILNDDVYFSPNSLLAMRRAAGGAVEAVRQLFLVDSATHCAMERSDVRASFAIVRPPGHHCCDKANGFCYFSNTAIAASHARKVLGLMRVAIVDWDFHHGDGQQAIFYKDPSVLTISLHVAMRKKGKRGVDDITFPGNRSMDHQYNGRGSGLGYNINIPWPHDHVGASDYEEAFRSVVIPALEGFDPDLVLVASGFDAVAGDALAGTRLPPKSYYDMTTQLLALQKPVAVILEGGYSPERLAQASLNVVHALLGWEPPRSEEFDSSCCCGSRNRSDSEVQRSHDPEAAAVLDAVRRRLNRLPPWNGKFRMGGAPYFHEDAASVNLKLVARLTQLIREQAVKA